MQAGSELRDVSAFLDAYMERCVKPAGLRSIAAVRSRVGVLKEHLGELPLTALEEPDEINRFKTESEYAEDVEIATMHRVLETLRAAMNWGMAQTPPLFNRSPFHRFGVRLNKKAETARDRRLTRDEEKRLLDTALQKMNTPEHQYVGALLHDRIIGALELCCRRGEMLMIQNKRVNWETCQIGIPGATTKDKENRRIPFNPKGRRRGDSRTASGARPRRVRVRQRNRSLPAEHPDRLGNSAATRERHRTEARKGGSAMESRTARTDRSPLARPASRRRVSLARGRRRHPHHSADARTREHSADATLLERDRRRTQERTGGELEQQRPTASPGVGKLIDLVSSTDCPRFVPGNFKMWLRGRATSGTCSCGAAQRDRSFQGPDDATGPVDVTAGLLSTYGSNAVPEPVVAHGGLDEPSRDSHSLGIDEPPASVLVDVQRVLPETNLLAGHHAPRRAASPTRPRILPESQVGRGNR